MRVVRVRRRLVVLVRGRCQARHTVVRVRGTRAVRVRLTRHVPQAVIRIDRRPAQTVDHHRCQAAAVDVRRRHVPRRVGRLVRQAHPTPVHAHARRVPIRVGYGRLALRQQHWCRQAARRRPHRAVTYLLIRRHLLRRTIGARQGRRSTQAVIAHGQRVRQRVAYHRQTFGRIIAETPGRLVRKLGLRQRAARHRDRGQPARRVGDPRQLIGAVVAERRRLAVRVGHRRQLARRVIRVRGPQAVQVDRVGLATVRAAKLLLQAVRKCACVDRRAARTGHRQRREFTGRTGVTAATAAAGVPQRLKRIAHPRREQHTARKRVHPAQARQRPARAKRAPRFIVQAQHARDRGCGRRRPHVGHREAVRVPTGR